MQSSEEKRPPRLKPALISLGLRGPEGPLFHGGPHISEFFRKLRSCALPKTRAHQTFFRNLFSP